MGGSASCPPVYTEEGGKDMGNIGGKSGEVPGSPL